MISFDFVEKSKSVYEMSSAGGCGVLDAEIINDQSEESAVGSVSERTGCRGFSVTVS